MVALLPLVAVAMLSVPALRMDTWTCACRMMEFVPSWRAAVDLDIISVPFISDSYVNHKYWHSSVWLSRRYVLCSVVGLCVRVLSPSPCFFNVFPAGVMPKCMSKLSF